MKVFKSLIPFALLALVAAWFYWALYTPKEDLSQRIYRTLKEQEKRADLSFKKVIFEEISGGEKFWQLEAETGIVNKNAGVATLQNTIGTFYKKGKAVLKFRSPAALWDMKKKEIYLDKPLGYDVNYERQIASLVKTLGTRPQSIFTLAKEYKKGLGYWFQAKNLSWKLADQMLFCTGGILLNKGEITGFADTLRGDVEFKKVLLEGNPRIEILPADRSPITFEARIFELSSTQNLFIAHGNPRVTWQEANLFSDSASYFQAEQKMALDGNVKINYKDILAWGNSASYLTEKQNVILSGDARAEQGDNKLSGDKVLVSLKENKISVLGKSRVVISGEKIKP